MKAIGFDPSEAMRRFVLKPLLKKVLETMLSDYKLRCRSARCCGDDGYVNAIAVFNEALRRIKQ